MKFESEYNSRNTRNLIFVYSTRVLLLNYMSSKGRENFYETLRMILEH